MWKRRWHREARAVLDLAHEESMYRGELICFTTLTAQAAPIRDHSNSIDSSSSSSTQADPCQLSVWR
ncbi:hypothetical protein BST61_g6088 [Cercospora zeina]